MKDTLTMDDLANAAAQCAPRHHAWDIMIITGRTLTPAMYLAVLAAMDVRVEVQGPYPVIMSLFMSSDAVIVLPGPPPSLDDLTFQPRLAFDWMDAEPPRSWGKRWIDICPVV